MPLPLLFAKPSGAQILSRDRLSHPDGVETYSEGENGRNHQNLPTESLRTDFEGKSSADDREPYKGTAREETAIVNKKYN